MKQYVDWISEFADYCHREGLNIYDGQSVKLFLVVYRHDTPKVAKRSNKRQKVSKEQDIKQKKTGELYSILSAIKHYTVCKSCSSSSSFGGFQSFCNSFCCIILSE